MSRRMLAAAAVAAAIGLAACSGGQAASQEFGKDDADQIRQLATDFVAAYNAQDIEKIGTFYSGNATLMPPNRSTLRGVDMVKGYYEGRIKEEGGTDLAFDELHLDGQQTLAYIYSTYQLNLRPAEGSEDHYRGKNLWVLRKLGGQWKIEAQMMSSDLPPATPPAQPEETGKK